MTKADSNIMKNSENIIIYQLWSFASENFEFNGNSKKFGKKNQYSLRIFYKLPKVQKMIF